MTKVVVILIMFLFTVSRVTYRFKEEPMCPCDIQGRSGLDKFSYLSGEWQLFRSLMVRIAMRLSLLPGRDSNRKDFIFLHTHANMTDHSTEQWHVCYICKTIVKAFE